MRFTVSGNGRKIPRYLFGSRYPCNGMDGIKQHTGQTVTHGKFKLLLSGRFKAAGRRAVGTIKGEFTGKDGLSCTSAAVDWHARTN